MPEGRSNELPITVSRRKALDMALAAGLQSPATEGPPTQLMELNESGRGEAVEDDEVDVGWRWAEVISPMMLLPIQG